MIHTILFIKSRISFTLWQQKRPRTYSSAVDKTKKSSRRTRVIFPAREHINVTLKIPSTTVFYRWTKIELDRKCSSASEWKIMIICSTTSDGRHLLWFHVEFLIYKSHSTFDVWKKTAETSCLTSPIVFPGRMNNTGLEWHGNRAKYSFN